MNPLPLVRARAPAAAPRACLTAALFPPPGPRSRSPLPLKQTWSFIVDCALPSRLAIPPPPPRAPPPPLRPLRRPAPSPCCPAAAPNSAAVTDPGVAGKENQDDSFSWQSPDGSTLVLGVFDGHGRDFGRVSASTARAAFLSALTSPAALAALREDPGPPLVAAFREAHDAVEAALAAACARGGWRVDRTPEGYLVRARPPPAPAGAPPQCVHGGTTATVLVVLDGRRGLPRRQRAKRPRRPLRRFLLSFRYRKPK